MRSLLIAAWFFLLSACCAPVPKPDQKPEWVGRVSWSDVEQKIVFGVGDAEKMLDEEMQLDRARNRAKRKVLAIFNDYFHFMWDLYEKHLKETNPNYNPYERDVVQVSHLITIADVKDAQAVKDWKGEDGTVYVLSSLDLPSMKAIMVKKEEILPDLRTWIEKNAERAFAEFGRSKTGE